MTHNVSRIGFRNSALRSLWDGGIKTLLSLCCTPSRIGLTLKLIMYRHGIKVMARQALHVDLQP